MRKFIWILLGLVVGWALIWCFCLKRHEVLPLTDLGVLRVQVAPVKNEDVIVTHEYIGHVEAIHAVSVHPYITGFVDKVLVRGGAAVRAGETLFVLKQDQYLAAVEAAEAKVVGATANLEKARLYLDRIDQTASEAISKTEKDNAQTNFLAAEAALAEAKADLKGAQVNYNYTVISSTINGVVGNIAVTQGEYVSPEGEALAYILQYDPIRIRFSMPEKDFLNLGANVGFFETGQLKLKLSNGKVIVATGSVRFADNQIQESTSSIDLFADFDNTKHLLLPGAYVTILYDETLKNVVLIDRHLVQMQSDGDYVYVLKENVVYKVPVTLGPVIKGKVIVEEGLRSGDLLIVSPITVGDVGKKAEILSESKDDPV